MIELAKTYDPRATEARWQQAWEESGAFHPDPEAPGEPFSLVTQGRFTPILRHLANRFRW